MITCYLRYEIDPFKVKEFETYGKMWIPLVNKFGGTHHGYYMPHEGPDTVAVAMFIISVAKAWAKSTASPPPTTRNARRPWPTTGKPGAF